MYNMTLYQSSFLDKEKEIKILFIVIPLHKRNNIQAAKFDLETTFLTSDIQHLWLYFPLLL
jgi:hypothetical protein